jgi:VanZ family protein
MKACYPGSMNTVFRIFAWFLAAATVFVTLAPIRYRPYSGFGKDAEHLMALLLVGLVFGLAYPRHRPIAAGVSIAAIAFVEALQLFVPGRDARLEDFAVKAIASCAGIAIAGLISWAVRSHWHARQ